MTLKIYTEKEFSVAFETDGTSEDIVARLAKIIYDISTGRDFNKSCGIYDSCDNQIGSFFCKSK